MPTILTTTKYSTFGYFIVLKLFSNYCSFYLYKLYLIRRRRRQRRRGEGEGGEAIFYVEE